MFDAVLAPNARAPRLLGRGAALSIGLHAVALAGSLYLSARAAHHAPIDPPTVTFIAAAPPPPPPPPPPAGGGEKAHTTPKPTPKPHPIVVPKDVPKEPDPEPEEKEEEPAPSSDPGPATGGVPGGVAGGVAGGVVGGTVGGVPGGVLGGVVGGTSTGVLPFGEGMTRPALLAGSEPVYTREALLARVQGLMIVKCTITVDGAIERCRVIKGLPFMDDAVTAALHTRRYTPVRYQGRAVAVDYVFNVKLVLP